MGKIVDINGNPIQTSVLTEQQTAQLGWITKDFARHPSRGITPRKIHEIMEEAEQGMLMRQADLFLDMEEKDAHIFAEMSKRKRALLTLDWRLVAPTNASEAEKSQTAQLQEWIDNIPAFDDVLLDAMDAVGHGYACQEITWQRLGKTWLPGSLELRPPRWFRTPYFDGNDLRLWDASADGAPLQPFGWLVHKHRAKSGYLVRGGLHRVLVWPYLYKNYALNDFAEFLEIYGLPLRVGKYPSGATDDEKMTLLRAVTDIGHNAGGIMPESMKIEFQTATQGTNDPFRSMIDWAEKSESKAILGGTLTSQADGKTSTNALGNTHNEVRHDLLVSDARQVQRTMTYGLVYMIAALNFGAVDPTRLPRFEFETREPEDLKLYADALPKLVAAGVRVPRQWAQDKLMIPEPQEGDEILSVPKPEMALPPEERPENPPRTAAMTYRAVLTNKSGQIVYADQHALDQAANSLAADQINEVVQKALGPAIAALRAGSTPDEVAELLMEYGFDDTSAQDLLMRCIFVAETWGRLNGG